VKLPPISKGNLDRLSELKATRDSLAHNDGVANEVYIRKAGALARAKAGERMTFSRPYVYDAADFLKDLVRSLTTGACAKLGK
jgi:hypothetical protein